MSADPQPKKLPGRFRKFLLGCTLGGAGLLLLLILLTIALALLFPDDPQTSPRPDSPTPDISRTPIPRPTGHIAPTVRPRPTSSTITPRSFTPIPRPTVSRASVVLQRANEYIQRQGGIRVTQGEMFSYCESLRDIQRDLLYWDELTMVISEAGDPPPSEFLRRRAHFEGVLVGLQTVSGSVQSGCASLGVR